MKDLAPTPPEDAPRRRWVGRGLLLLALAATAWLGWREYDHRAAIREALAAGCERRVREPIALIRADWHAAFQKSTWTERYWELDVEGRDLASLRPLLLRLRPTVLIINESKYANFDALHGLSGLQSLHLNDCTALQNVDGLKGLSGLQGLYLGGCTALQNVDGLKGLSGLQVLTLDGCTALQNVDGLKGLSGLQWLSLSGCPKIPAAAVAELRAVLPKTTISSD